MTRTGAIARARARQNIAPSPPADVVAAEGTAIGVRHHGGHLHVAQHDTNSTFITTGIHRQAEVHRHISQVVRTQ